MSKTLKIYIGALVLVFIGLVIFQASIPKPIDWTPTFNEKQTLPFATKVFRDELPNLFPNESVINIYQTAYEFLNEYYNEEDTTFTIQSNYIKIHPEFNIDEVSTEKLLEFVGYGNTAFIAAEYFPKILQDSLQFNIKNGYSFDGQLTLKLLNKTFVKDSVEVSKGSNNYYFKNLNKKNTTILGLQKDEKEYINFVKIKYKKGYFFLHTQPYAFSNYYLLKDSNYKYIADVLTYLPNGTILFDSDYKKNTYVSNSPLRYILSQPPLKWAWFLALFFIITFMFFNAKRRQRAIKIITPLQNTSVQFTKTVSNLYYESKNHTNIIDKKITYFFEQIRRDYYLSTDVLDDNFINKLTAKTGGDKQKVKKLIQYIHFLKTKTAYTEKELIDLNKLIEEFHQKK